MALVNATLNLKLDRVKGTFTVTDTSTRVYSQDENVSLNVTGWTLEEVTKTSGKTPYEPYFRIVDVDMRVLAECKLSPDSTPAPETDGSYAMRGTLSTNTDKMVAAFQSGGYQPGWQYDFNALIFSTTSANPISTGAIYIWAFDTSDTTAPSNLPTASEALEELEEKIDEHIEDASNPHSVTAEQVGAPTKTYADATYATIATAANLQSLITSANAAIAALQTAMQTANLAIQSNIVALTTKANVANTYRKDETYSQTQVNELVSLNKAMYLLAGKSFAKPTNDRERTELLVCLVKALGGNINATAATPSILPSTIALKAVDGNDKSIRIVMNDGGEYTTEVI